MAGHPCLTLRATSLPPRRSGEYRKGMFPARPLYQVVRGSVWNPEPSTERVGDWGGPETVCVWSLLCVAERRAKRPNGEWGYSTRRHMLGHECPEALSPEEALYLQSYRPSVIHLIVNKLLSLSLSTHSLSSFGIWRLGSFLFVCFDIENVFSYRCCVILCSLQLWHLVALAGLFPLLVLRQSL